MHLDASLSSLRLFTEVSENLRGNKRKYNILKQDQAGFLTSNFLKGFTHDKKEIFFI